MPDDKVSRLRVLHAFEPFGSQIKIGRWRVRIRKPRMLVDCVHEVGTVGVFLPAVSDTARLQGGGKDGQTIVARQQPR